MTKFDPSNHILPWQTDPVHPFLTKSGMYILIEPKKVCERVFDFSLNPQWPPGVKNLSLIFFWLTDAILVL